MKNGTILSTEYRELLAGLGIAHFVPRAFRWRLDCTGPLGTGLSHSYDTFHEMMEVFDRICANGSFCEIQRFFPDGSIYRDIYKTEQGMRNGRRYH